MNPSNPPSSVAKLHEEELKQLLDLELGDAVEDRIRQALLLPVCDLLARPKKNLRAQLTEIGAHLGGKFDAETLHIAFEVIEALHAGSLAVDDIEDGSTFRRGEPSLHERYGVPIALNAGNWLYFWPLELVRRMNVTPEKELAIYHLYHRTLLRAHFGQALDVGIEIDTVPVEKIYPTCLASLELKSGTLTAFAIGLGGLIADVPENILQAMLRFGHRFGVALQMLDDIGNFDGQRDPLKKWEDLKLRRPTWMWACLAESEGDRFDSFREAVASLPDEARLTEWIAKNHEILSHAKQKSFRFLEKSLEDFRSEISGYETSSKVWTMLEAIKVRLMNAYD